MNLKQICASFGNKTDAQKNHYKTIVISDLIEETSGSVTAFRGLPPGKIHNDQQVECFSAIDRNVVHYSLLAGLAELSKYGIRFSSISDIIDYHGISAPDIKPPVIYYRMGKMLFGANGDRCLADNIKFSLVGPYQGQFSSFSIYIKHTIGVNHCSPG